MGMREIVAAKLEQAAGLLREFRMPCWIVQFGRETHDHPSPIQHLAVGTSVTWPSAFLVTDAGRTVAIVGTGDVAGIRAFGAYGEVIGYVQDVAEPLRQVLGEIDPARIGVSYALSDDQADGITHGMYRILEESLAGTSYLDRLESAERVAGALRARKLPIEVERIRRAIDVTVGLFDDVERMLRPGITERAVADTVHQRVANLGGTMAWDAPYDPVVNFGPASAFGHAPPGDISLEPGMLVHVDLGIKLDGYCSDLQRMWYALAPGEDAPPPDVQAAFDGVVGSMRAGFVALKPGVEGWTVDAAARGALVGAGFDEPQFALGHQLGQTTHDGGALLGPRWPRYGDRPMGLTEETNVFTLEYGVMTSAGVLGVEEDVVVTAGGCDYLTPPQEGLKLLRLQ